MEDTPKKRVHAAKDMTCTICGTLVPKVPFYRQQTFRCCSRKCTRELQAREQQRVVSCTICSKDFIITSPRKASAKYCSNVCKGLAMKGRGRTEFECQHCHIKFMAPKSTKRKFCSRACINKASKLVWRPTYTAARLNMLNAGKLQSCERCGYDDYPNILGVHHKDRNHKNNTPENLEVLCPNCHSLEHKRHISHGGSKHQN